MKLYNLGHSPFSTRLRIQIRKKQLPIEIVPPPLTLRSAEFLEAYPFGKVPMLELDNGDVLPESGAIMEYLEDCFADATPLRAEDPVARAKMRALLRFCDTSLNPSLFPLFKALMAPAGDTDTSEYVQAVHLELTKLNRWFEREPFEARGLDLADIGLVPVLWYVAVVMSAFGENNVLAGYPQVENWWARVQSDAVIRETTEELATAYQDFMSALSAR